MIVQTTKQFTPVTITLETQEEVDKIFALINHFQIAKALNIEEEHKKFSGYYSQGYVKYHNILQKVF